MALLYGLLWWVLLALVRLKRAVVSWLSVRFRGWTGRLWERAIAVLLLPVAVSGFPDYKTTLNPTHDGTEKRGEARRSRLLTDRKSLEKLPVHVGFMVAEEEPSFTDIANLVVWCMAVGVSYVSVYDNYGFFQKNNSLLQEAIIKQQQHLLGTDRSKYSVELLKKGHDDPQQCVVSCRPTVKVLSPEDGKHSIVQAARQLCHSVETKQRSSRDIDVSMLDVLLRESKNIPDPELVVKFGPVNSTLGFLPWHIRLTEFISLPSHRKVSYEDLFGALQRYSACQQRLGQ